MKQTQMELAARVYRVLTLTQPWASLVVLGLKRIETRSWATSYRGPLLIHAAKGYLDRGLRHEMVFLEAFWSVGVKPDMPLPTGAIIGSVDLIDCVPTVAPFAGAAGAWFVATHNGQEWQVPPPEPELSFGDYSDGRWAWLLNNPRAFPTPIPARGALKIWEWTPPAGVSID